MADPKDPNAVSPIAIDETLAAPGALTPRTPVGTSSGRRAEGPAMFQSGDLVAERYKIVKPLGEGGMGEVYEAEDLLLREHVALKTLRGSIADDETTLLRFKREIQLSRKVTHPNVCRIFDVGLDRRGGRDNAFLTMELVIGETLAARLRRVGRLGLAEALPIAEQIANALVAAHAAGVVHRDLKCANVLLVGGGAEVRAVVTDFGLARAAAAEDGDSVTGDGGVVGSPAYMAPEQVEGGRRLTGAVDIYAFGVVLFEMVTGRLPFVGETPLATAVMRVREPPPSPKTFVPDLDERWERTILFCLGRTPEQRPASAFDVVRLLRGEMSPPPLAPEVKAPPHSPPKRWRRSLLGGVSALLLVSGGWWAAQHDRRRRNSDEERPVPGARPQPPAPPAAPQISVKVPGFSVDVPGGKVDVPAVDVNVPVPGGPEGIPGAPTRNRRAVAILGFRNLSERKEVAYISTAVGEMLSTELTSGEDLRTIPGESIQRAKRQLSLIDAESYAPDTLRKLRRLIDADVAISGTYVMLGGDRVRLDLRLQDTRSGESIGSIAETGDLDDLSSLVEQVGERVRDSLHVEEPTPSEREHTRGMMPRDTDVTRLYSEGLALMRVDHCSAARGPLEQAVAADPEFALAHQALAEVLACLGYDGRALAEAKRAVELAQSLPPETRLQAEGYLHQLTDQWDKALAAYEELFKRAPDNYDFGLKLLRLEKGHAPDKARRLLAVLRRMPSPAGDSPELDFVEATLKPDDDDKLVAFEKARQNAEEHGARLIAASAQLQSADLRIRRNELDAALNDARGAKQVFEASGDRDGVIQALQLEAMVYQKRNDTAGARRALRDAQELGKHLDSVRSLAKFEQTMARMMIAQGNLGGAESALSDVMRMRDRNGNGENTEAAVGAHFDTALVQLYRGDLRAARKEITRAGEMAEKAESAKLQGMALYVEALVATVGGDESEAQQLMAEAMKIFPEMKEWCLPDYLESRVALAAGHPEAAEKAARAALANERGRDFVPPLGREIALLDSLFAQGGKKGDEIKALLGKLRGPAGDKDAFASRLALDIYVARQRGMSPREADKIAAMKSLAEVTKRAAESDFVMHRLLADAERGRIELTLDKGAGERSLAKVIKEAQKLGFGALASEMERLVQ